MRKKVLPLILAVVLTASIVPLVATPVVATPDEVLYGIIGDEYLVTIDPVTGDATEVAMLDYWSESISLRRIGFDPNTNELYGLACYISSSGLGAPMLTTIDACTGVVTLIGDIDLPGETEYFAESMAIDPSGTIYVAMSIDGADPADWKSETLVTVDPETAEATLVGTISGTWDDDADQLVFVGDTLYAADHPPPHDAHLYTLAIPSTPPGTVVATLMGTLPGGAGISAYNPTTGRLFGVNPDRQLLDIGLPNGSPITVIGDTHDPSEFGGHTVCALAWGPEPVNEVWVSFVTSEVHSVPGDSFVDTGSDVPGEAEWGVAIQNIPDCTGAPVSGLNLALDTLLEFDRVEHEELLTQTGPPTYEWSFGDLSEGDLAGVGVRFPTPVPYPVSFTPGFDASRELSQREFEQSGGTQTQEVTISITPRTDETADEGLWLVLVTADYPYRAPDEYDVVDVEIPGAWDGKQLLLFPGDLTRDVSWETTVEIEVTPKVPRVEFAPCVQVFWYQDVPIDMHLGSSISHVEDLMGEWTASAVGEYGWHEAETARRIVEFQSHCGDGIDDFSIDHMFINFGRRHRLDEIVGKASFHLAEGATYDLSIDDVTVNIDGVDITIPAGSFRKRGPFGGERYIYNSRWWVKPKIFMELDFEDGEWRLMVHDIDADAINSYDGVDVAFCIGYMAAKESIDMRIGGLSYVAEQ